MKRFALLAILLVATPLFAQQRFEEKIDVNTVLLDVIVTDAKGNQILGLTKDDFIVTENGVAQSIDSVDYYTNRRLLTGREETAPFKVERIIEDRYFVFFFDKPEDLAGSFDVLARARQGVTEWIEKEMQPNDYVAIVGHDVRLKIYTDFTNDRKRIASALADAASFGRGRMEAPKGEGPSILRSISEKELVETGRIYESLHLLADALRPIRGRKNLVLFSPGIVDNRETVRYGSVVSRSPALDPMLHALNAANVTVYGVQLQQDFDITPLFHQRVEEISETTGGRYFAFNVSFTPALKEIDDVNNGYYLLSYRSPHEKGTSGYQDVKVSVKNPEFRVKARSGYRYGV